MHVRTDPRDPANTVERRSGWLSCATACVRSPAQRTGRNHAVSDWLGGLCAQSNVVLELHPRDRARGLAWFLTSDGAVRTAGLRVQLHPGHARAMGRPFVPASSMWSTVAVRPGWCWSASRPFGCTGKLGWCRSPNSRCTNSSPTNGGTTTRTGHSGRTPAGMHVATFDQRIEEWRQRFLAEAAIAIGKRVAEFGWQRVLLAGYKPVLDGFADRLPDPVREQVIVAVDANVLWEEPAADADRLDDALDKAGAGGTRAADRPRAQASFEGGRGARWQKCSTAWCSTVSGIGSCRRRRPGTRDIAAARQRCVGQSLPSDARRACRRAERSPPAPTSPACLTPDDCPFYGGVVATPPISISADVHRSGYDSSLSLPGRAIPERLMRTFPSVATRHGVARPTGRGCARLVVSDTRTARASVGWASRCTSPCLCARFTSSTTLLWRSWSKSAGSPHRCPFAAGEPIKAGISW